MPGEFPRSVTTFPDLHQAHDRCGCSLVACEFEVEPEQRAAFVEHLWRAGAGHGLVLDTCQRMEWFGDILPRVEHPPRTVWSGTAAFERLARIAAGLESRLLGELEVLGQVRDAYRKFAELSGGNARILDRVFQDVLELARRARRESGLDQIMTSWASAAVRELLSRIEPDAPVAVVGSGQLALSVARRLAKRGRRAIRIVGRCPDNALRLAMEVGGFAGGLDQLSELLDNVGGIVCATAAPHPVLYARHLARARRPLTIVDLGLPPDCAEDVRTLSEVVYVDTGFIERQMQQNWEERRRRAAIAAQIVAEGARRWQEP